MATGELRDETKGAAESRPHHLIRTPGSLGPKPATVIVETEDHYATTGTWEWTARAEVEVDYDREKDHVVVTIRRLEDDPTVRVVLV